jgi:hypothetical protein
MEAASSFEMSVTISQSTRHHIPEDLSIHGCCRENLKCCKHTPDLFQTYFHYKHQLCLMFLDACSLTYFKLLVYIMTLICMCSKVTYFSTTSQATQLISWYIRQMVLNPRVTEKLSSNQNNINISMYFIEGRTLKIGQKIVYVCFLLAVIS